MTLPYEPAAHLASRMLREKVVSRIWNRDVSVWNASPGSIDARSISNRLGWLDVGSTMPPLLDQVETFATGCRQEGAEAALLLGMGGSSLCAEVLRSVYGGKPGSADLLVLDTTDERTLTAAAAGIDPGRTLAIVASKSGGTVEVASMEQFFWDRLSAALGMGAGRQFVAITDPGTPLQQLAAGRGYRATFVNPADIGGRFSALSLFGLIPAAWLGASARDLLAAGTVMAAGCRQENHANAGLELGAFIGAATLAGRSKLTVLLPPSLQTLGLWIEQLVAESTGKHGKGALPVVDEPLGSPDEYGDDRAFVAIASERDEPDRGALAALERAGHPVLRLSTRLEHIGAEFFRWEFATAVAGAALGINPFDEPNVAEAKEKTKRLLAAYRDDGRLPETAPAARGEGVAAHSPTFTGGTPAAVLRAAVDSLRPGDYVAFLSYLPADSAVQEAVSRARLAIRGRTRAATTFGVGPRYLHSTGQYHKGGPNTALAVVLTADDASETPIPEAGYSFAVLKRAQALGDIQALEAHGRRVVRLHVTGEDSAGALERTFAEALR